MDKLISIILPAKNEAPGLRILLPKLLSHFRGQEIIVVDDGSTDETTAVCREFGVDVHSHPYSMGNGAAIKSGARRASGDVLVFMDADCQHEPDRVNELLGKLNQGFDMVIGARALTTHASLGRWIGNAFYNRFASLIVGQRIEDLTSGFRAANADQFREVLHLLPNGFSYPTTSTMAFLRLGYPIAYVPIRARRRIGKSHIRIIRDGVRFLLIMFKIGTLYSPLKIFMPFSLGFFALGLSYYLFTYFTQGRFTNMSALLFITSVLVFLIGLVSEQITLLMYSDRFKK